MADIEQALYTKLSGTAAISAIVSTRIYPVKMPDNATFPCITLQRILSDRIYTMDGGGNFTISSFEINCWAKNDHSQAKDLARKITTALSGFKGTVSGVDIQAILQENETDTWEPDVEVYRTIQRYGIQHIEAI